MSITCNHGQTPIHQTAQKLSKISFFVRQYPNASSNDYLWRYSNSSYSTEIVILSPLTINFLHYEVFVTPNEFVNIQSTFITQNVKKGSADLELASEGITNVTEYCKLLPVALFPKHQQLWYGVLGLSL